MACAVRGLGLPGAQQPVEISYDVIWLPLGPRFFVDTQLGAVLLRRVGVLDVGGQVGGPAGLPHLRQPAQRVVRAGGDLPVGVGDRDRQPPGRVERRHALVGGRVGHLTLVSSPLGGMRVRGGGEPVQGVTG